MGFPGTEDSVEEGKKTLFLDLGDSFANGQTHHIAVPDQSLVGRIDLHEPVFKTLEKGRKARRLREHFS